MRALLIGGTGFIGPHVARALQRLGHDVAVFHRSAAAQPGATASAPTRSMEADGPLAPLTHVAGDRRDLAASADQLHAFGADVVVDLILSSGRQARELMNVFRGHAQRVVALSSCDVYRACGVLHELEDGPLEPLPLTEASALRTTRHTYPPAQIRKLQHVFGWLDEEYDKIPVEHAILGDASLPGTVLRLPMVYGPGDRLHRFLPTLERMDRGEPIVLEQKHASWRAPRGFVANVAAAIALAATSPRAAGRIYNVAERESFSELEWIRLIAAAVDWHGDLVVLPADRAPADAKMPGNLDQHWVVDTTRIREELGYQEPVAREASIAQTIAWERTNLPTRARR
jgi:nucleoside-diphosphate-sugar epimerase